MPYQLHKHDYRTDVRRKLAAFEHTRKSWVNDVWEIGTTRLTAIYSKDSECLERLAFRQMPRPIPAVNVATTGDLIDIVALLGHSVQSPRVQQVFGEAFVDEMDEDEIDLRMTRGITLYLQGIRRRAIVNAITLHANRDGESPGWNGPLPQGLDFADSPTIAREKVGICPSEESDSPTTGHVVWTFLTYTLHILYSNFDNSLLRVTLRAPGHAACL